MLYHKAACLNRPYQLDYGYHVAPLCRRRSCRRTYAPISNTTSQAICGFLRVWCSASARQCHNVSRALKQSVIKRKRYMTRTSLCRRFFGSSHGRERLCKRLTQEHACHRHNVSQFLDFSLTKIKFPWAKEYLSATYSFRLMIFNKVSQWPQIEHTPSVERNITYSPGSKWNTLIFPDYSMTCGNPEGQ